ncbi:hypothetical protein OPQ81_011538 [Rhizoctonia solani]|nr:hypothetical protein OPQ81_011538 [Rhizoctonia solani]
MARMSANCRSGPMSIVARVNIGKTAMIVIVRHYNIDIANPRLLKSNRNQNPSSLAQFQGDPPERAERCLLTISRNKLGAYSPALDPVVSGD